jgi:hypothetical protein
MGNANLTGANPNIKSPQVNLCSTTTWDRGKTTEEEKARLLDNDALISVPEFCSDPDLYPKLNTELCTNIGDPTEWDVYQRKISNGCLYNDCNPGFTVQSGCNGKCCSWSGYSTSCARTAYNANEVVCCFNDYACQNDIDKCFQTPERQKTCDPNYRDLTSTNCQQLVEPYCKGESLFPSQSDWIEMWLEDSEVEINSSMELSTDVYPKTKFSPEVIVSERGRKYPMAEKQPCLRAIARNITNGRICSWDQLQQGEVVTGSLDPQGLQWGKEIINAVYNKYISENGKDLLTGINTDGFSRDAGFYNTLWDICNKVPLLCTNGNQDYPQGILPELCANITAETLSSNPDVIKWCACHMPEEQYAPYLDKFGLTKECTPLCNRPGVLPPVDTDGEVRYCTQSLCVVDQNNIDITNSQFEEGINFNNICSGCGNSNISRSFKQVSGESDSTTSTTEVKYTLNNVPTQVIPNGDYFSVYGQNYDLSQFTSGAEDFTRQVPFLTLDDYNNNKSYTTIDGEDNGIVTLIVQFNFISLYNYIGVTAVETISSKKNNSELTKPFVVAYYFDGGNSPENIKKLNVTQPNGFFAGTNANMTLSQVSSRDFSAETVSRTTQTYNYGSATSSVTTSTCSCIMDGINLQSADSLVKGSANFTNSCGQSKCVNTDGEQVSCSETKSRPQPIDTVTDIEIKTARTQTEEKYSTIFYILISIVLFIIIFDIIKAFLRKYH